MTAAHSLPVIYLSRDEEIVGSWPRWYAEEQRRCFAPPFPRCLYKYARLDHDRQLLGLRTILRDSCVHLASPLDFNDPFDVRAHIEEPSDRVEVRRYLKRIYRAHGTAPESADAFASKVMAQGSIRQMAEEAFETSIGQLGVSCFTAQPRSVLMWSHYADQHRGICLQFHTVRASAMFALSRRVEYQDDVLVLNFADTKRIEVLSRVVATRASDWSYECEHRVVRPEGANMLLPFPASALVGIVLGCRLDGAGMSALADVLSERAKCGHPRVRLFRARKHPREYGLVIQRAADLERKLAQQAA